ncbi:hypothetical protein NPIL_633511 [Nephila pilipes]|uniref:Uncharacterized protein n=1 Tax=Nephila pilipes TaxID=299642 RepID=A0A8X6IR28_NEPPI|nr:hypothetical protein NPIL_633511 [Nephila pilipes]
MRLLFLRSSSGDFASPKLSRRSLPALLGPTLINVFNFSARISRMKMTSTIAIRRNHQKMNRNEHNLLFIRRLSSEPNCTKRSRYFKHVCQGQKIKRRSFGILMSQH